MKKWIALLSAVGLLLLMLCACQQTPAAPSLYLTYNGVEGKMPFSAMESGAIVSGDGTITRIESEASSWADPYKITPLSYHVKIYLDTNVVLDFIYDKYSVTLPPLQNGSYVHYEGKIQIVRDDSILVYPKSGIYLEENEVFVWPY